MYREKMYCVFSVFLSTKPACSQWLDDKNSLVFQVSQFSLGFFWGVGWGVSLFSSPKNKNTSNCPRIVHKCDLALELQQSVKYAILILNVYWFN